MPMSAFEREPTEEVEDYIRTVEENKKAVNRAKELANELVKVINGVKNYDLKLGLFASVVTWLINESDLDLFEAYGAIMYALFRHMLDAHLGASTMYLAYITERRVMGS